MSEIKNIKRKFWKEIVQITYKIRKVKDVYDKVLQKGTCKLQNVLHKSAKSIKNDMKNTKICSKISNSGKPAPRRNQPTNPQWK